MWSNSSFDFNIYQHACYMCICNWNHIYLVVSRYTYYKCVYRFNPYCAFIQKSHIVRCLVASFLLTDEFIEMYWKRTGNAKKNYIWLFKYAEVASQSQLSSQTVNWTSNLILLHIFSVKCIHFIGSMHTSKKTPEKYRILPTCSLLIDFLANNNS